MNLYIKFDSLEDFYKEAMILEETGNKAMFHENKTRNNKSFIGLSLRDIYKHKYSYEPGIEKLHTYKDLLLDLGSSKFKYKWDDVDGDDMDMERLYDGQNFLKKRIRNKGTQNGKFIDLFVFYNECAWVEYEEMLNKAYTAVSIADYLEDQGFHVSIYAMAHSIAAGSYGSEELNSILTEVKIKDYNEPLNKSLLLTVISPWMFRYWTFCLKSAKTYTPMGMGISRPLQGDFSKCTKEKIVINVEECLEKESSIKKIEEIVNLFEKE